MTYKQSREDFERLEEIEELSVQDELEEARLPLMQNPNKIMAIKLYRIGIMKWAEQEDRRGTLHTQEVHKILSRYGHYLGSEETE